MIEVARRSFITGLIALVAAPAIVRAGSIMPVKSYATNEQLLALLSRRIIVAEELMAIHIKEWMNRELYGDGASSHSSGLALLCAEVVQEPAPWRMKGLTAGVAVHG